MSNTVENRSDQMLLREGRALGKVPVWLAVVLPVVLVVVALAAGVLVGRATKADTAPPADLASAATNSWIRDHVAAVNSGDEARIRTFYADDATMTDIGNLHAAPLKGGATIARTLAANHALLGDFLDEPGTAVRRDQFISYVGSWGDVRTGVVVYELDDQGKILNIWAIHPAQ